MSDETPVSDDSVTDTQESKSEKMMKLLEPYSKEQLIELLCRDEASYSFLLNRIRQFPLNSPPKFHQTSSDNCNSGDLLNTLGFSTITGEGSKTTSLDLSVSLLAACGGDTIKLLDFSVESDSNLCKLSFSPSPGEQVNSVRWNHTNLVVASASNSMNEISLWHKNGKSFETLTDAMIKENVLAISFSNKTSRYMCSGGSARVVKVWDMKTKDCYAWLSGHVDTITGVMFDCEDKQLASISLSGDIIFKDTKFNRRGRKRMEIKDPNKQALRVLDYSRISQHLLVTAGDDGSVHLWDTTGIAPKVSWYKQHSASTTGISFSPLNDKIIACVGLDKMLFILDSESKTPIIRKEHGKPLTSLAFRDDGLLLAAGTNDGQIILFDIRATHRPLKIHQTYTNSESVRSLCWQRLNPITVNENSCDVDTALMGEDQDSPLGGTPPLPEWLGDFMKNYHQMLKRCPPSSSSFETLTIPSNLGNSSQATGSTSPTPSKCSPFIPGLTFDAPSSSKQMLKHDI